MQNVIGAKASRARLPSNGRSLSGWSFLRLAGSIVSTSTNGFLTGTELLESSDCVGPGMVLICTSSPFRESDWGALPSEMEGRAWIAWAMRRKLQQDGLGFAIRVDEQLYRPERSTTEMTFSRGCEAGFDVRNLAFIKKCSRLPRGTQSH